VIRTEHGGHRLVRLRVRVRRSTFVVTVVRITVVVGVEAFGMVELPVAVRGREVPGIDEAVESSLPRPWRLRPSSSRGAVDPGAVDPGAVDPGAVDPGTETEGVAPGVEVGVVDAAVVAAVEVGVVDPGTLVRGASLSSSASWLAGSSLPRPREPPSSSRRTVVAVVGLGTVGVLTPGTVAVVMVGFTEVATVATVATDALGRSSPLRPLLLPPLSANAGPPAKPRVTIAKTVAAEAVRRFREVLMMVSCGG
jgi:hypothetical protein